MVGFRLYEEETTRSIRLLETLRIKKTKLLASLIFLLRCRDHPPHWLARLSPILYITLLLLLHLSFLIAQDEGTHIEFRNVGFYTLDAGEIPKRT